jgi:hypothetical protein
MAMAQARRALGRVGLGRRKGSGRPVLAMSRHGIAAEPEGIADAGFGGRLGHGRMDRCNPGGQQPERNHCHEPDNLMSLAPAPISFERRCRSHEVQSPLRQQFFGGVRHPLRKLR